MVRAKISDAQQLRTTTQLIAATNRQATAAVQEVAADIVDLQEVTDGLDVGNVSAVLASLNERVTELEGGV